MADDSLAVLGDMGELYVSADIIPIYKELLVYSTIITPNWFEVEYVQQTISIPALSLTAIQNSHRNHFRFHWIPKESLENFA